MEQLQIYKCDVCGNIVEVMHGGAGELTCCGQPMKLFRENTVDAAKEKHVPVVEKTAYGFKVKVGSVAHPMGEKHWIEWVELIADGKVYRQFLKPPGADADPEICALVERRQALEERVAALKASKDKMEPEAYAGELERLLIDLARTNAAIKEKVKG